MGVEWVELGNQTKVNPLYIYIYIYRVKTFIYTVGFLFDYIGSIFTYTTSYAPTQRGLFII